MTPETCPNCGADVPPRAKACPNCGACEQTGWAEDSDSAQHGASDESFNYDEFVQREFGPKRALPFGIGPFWWLVSIALIGVLLWLVFR